ncbi:TPA: hypothetical protein ACSZFQ_14895 [Listeria monocytogenes]
MTTPEKSKEWYEQELKLRFRHFYGQTDGTYDFPNSLEGDLLKMTFKMLYLPSANNFSITKAVEKNMDTLKQYVVVDYDDNNRVVIIDSDRSKCLSAIEMILGNDNPDLDLEEIMKDEAWDKFGFAIFEHERTAI